MTCLVNHAGHGWLKEKGIAVKKFDIPVEKGVYVCVYIYKLVKTSQPWLQLA